MSSRTITTASLPERPARFSRDRLPHLVNCAVQLGRVAVHSRVAALRAWWWGVELGPDCRFFGQTQFRRLPGSHIRIGRKCEFRSAKWSNLVGINRPCILATLSRKALLEIGEGSGFSGATIGCASTIRIGDRVMCGANVTITDTDWHPLDWRERAAGVPADSEPVSIGDDVWLGMNVMVLKGVEIGRRTVVAAGSIVSRSLPEGVIAAGQPARVVRRLPEGVRV